MHAIGTNLRCSHAAEVTARRQQSKTFPGAKPPFCPQGAALKNGARATYRCESQADAGF